MIALPPQVVAMYPRSLFAALLAWSMALSFAGAADTPPIERGRLRCGPCPLEDQVPERFRLTSEEVAWQRRMVPDISPRYDLSRVTFPSPLKTASEKNNTVHCEYFLPRGAGKRPAVIVL